MAYTASSGAVIRIGVDGADESRRQIETVTASMNRLSNTVSTAFKTLSSTIGLGSGLAGIIQMSDGYSKFTSQLRLAAQSNSEYATSLESVRRISHDAQQELAAVGTLYARIANGTRELGVSQQRVADITDVVSLSLRVSGATAEESASAQLQLSQAFASGTLRGEEFNAVNEAAPRLMLALADGIGVPVGALKNMASNGLITSQVMADVLPKALGQLREEAKQVQTIGGAFTVLKNNVLEFTAVHAQANGTVAILTRGIGLLADNLSLVTGAVTTLTAVKIGTWLESAATKAYQSVTANSALAASNLATARADVAATGAASALATARVAELRAAVLASEGNVALAITSNGLIPAQARAAVAAEAHAAALATLATATGAASVGAGILRGALGLLGGPVGAVITVLGLAATAWSWWSSKANDASKETTEAVAESTTQMIARLDKQIEKLKERNELLKVVPSVKGISEADQQGLSNAKAELDAARNGTGAYTGQSSAVRQIAEIDLLARYEAALQRVTIAQGLLAQAEKGTHDEQLKKFFGENGTSAQRLAYELENVKKQFGMLTPEMEKAVRAKYADKGAAAAVNKEATAYETLISSIRAKTEENRLELAVGTDATESQKTSIKITQELASGKLKLGSAHLAVVRAALAEQSASEQLLKAQAAEKDVMTWIIQSTQARLAANDALSVEYQMYGQSADAREIAMVAVKAEADLLKDIAEIEKKNGKLSEESIAQMRREMEMRVGVTQATLAQTKALGYAGQLKTENERYAAESIQDEQDRAEALLAIDAKLWTDRITQAGEGTEAQRVLQEQYMTWYRNQANKPMLDEWKKSVEKYDDIFRNGLADMLNNGRSAWSGFTKSLTTTFKTGFADQIYKLFAKPLVVNLIGNVLGISGESGLAQIAGSAGSSAAGNGLSTGLGLAGLGASFGGSAMAGLSAAWAAGGSLAGTLSTAIAGATAAPMASLGLAMGALAPVALGLAAAVAIWKSQDTSGTYHTGGGASASAAGVTTIRAESLNFEATRVSAETEKMTAALASGIVGILDSTASAFGKTAGYTAATAFADDTSKDGAWGGLVISKLGSKILDWQDTKTGSWAPKTFSDGAAGQAEYLAALSGSVRTALDGIGLPSWAGSMLDALGAAPTIEQLTTTVNSIVATQTALATLGDRLAGFAGMSDAAASALMVASGGIDKLAANASSYYDNFYTETEKTAVVTKQLTTALADVGIAMPATREAYRQQIEAQLKLGEAGAKAVAVLLGGASAFASITAATEQLAGAADQLTSSARSAADILAERVDLQKQLDELTMSSAQLLAQKRDAIDASNRSLFDQVQAVKSAKATTEAQTAAVASAMSSLKTLTDAAMSDVTKSAVAEKSRLSAIRDVAAESVRSITGVFDLLRDQVASLYGTVSSTSAMQASQGAAFIDRALATVTSTGYLPDQQQLASAIAAARGGLDANEFATQFEADRAALVMAGKLSQIQAASGDQLNTAEASLRVANAQLSALDAQLALAQQQVDTLNGISAVVLSMPSAMSALTAAIKMQATAAAVSASAAGGVSAVAAPASVGMSVSDLYQQVLGRSPDKSGLDFWTAAYGSSVSQSEMTDFLAAAAPELSAKAGGTWEEFLKQKGIPGYASGGDFAGGLRFVGERGIELEATGPSRIFSHEQLQGMIGGGNTERLERLVEALTTEVQRLRSDVADGNRNMAQLADQFDNATEGGNGLRTVTIEDRT